MASVLGCVWPLGNELGAMHGLCTTSEFGSDWGTHEGCPYWSIRTLLCWTILRLFMGEGC